jgi:NhaP-type Na+/H+ or K+/H+ antiporter/rhodanese-related sulfurtransferase
VDGLTTEVFTTSLALVGVVVIVAALLSGVLERSGLPQMAVLLGLGAAVGPFGLDLVHVGLESPSLRVLATLSLALVLFTDALSLDVRVVSRKRGLAALLLGPGTLASAALFAVLAWWLLDFPPAIAAIVGAALASTDPVLLRGLLRRPDLATSARVGLRLESGLNDVVLLPIVLVAMTFLEARSADHAISWGRLAIDLLVLSPGAGVVVGVFGISAIDLVRRRVGVRRDYESLYSLGICFTAFAAAEAVHGSGFIAAFAAGLTISAFDVVLCDCFKEYGETTAELTLLFTFVLLGGSLIWTGLGQIGMASLAFTALVLLGRPAIYFLALLGTDVDAKSRAWIAWFGPRGLSSLLLVLLPAFAGHSGGETPFALVSLVVLCSVALHGGALMALSEPTPAGSSTPMPPIEPDQTLISVERVDELRASGAEVRLIDARTQSAYDETSEGLAGAVRLSLQSVAEDARRLALPKDAWLIAFCTCEGDSTAIRIASDLTRAGYPRARALKDGWDAAIAAGWPMERRADA